MHCARSAPYCFLLILFFSGSPMISNKKVYILTGSNIEPRVKFLMDAKREIEMKVGGVTRSSQIYESEAWGFESDDCFLNQVLVVETKETPEKVLSSLLEIEKKLGRSRIGNAYQSRTIDIDILYYDNVVSESADLIIPHPRLHQRNFTLLPLVEIASDFIHPKLKLSNLELVKKNTDKTKVWKYEGLDEV